MSDSAATPEPEAPTTDPTASSPKAADTSATDTSASNAPPVDVPPANATAGESGESGEQKPSDRIRIGSQRPSSSQMPEQAKPKPKPTNPVSESKSAPAPSKYPPPNVRAALSEEQEAELEAALAGESLDDLIGSAPGAATAELAPETRITGRVSTQHGDHVFVDLGGPRQGAIPLKQFGDKTPPEAGAEIEVVVARLNADEGLYELSLPAAATVVGNWEEVEQGQIIEVAITGHNKGGLECQAAGIRGFMPMGQISLYRVETPEDFVGQKLAAVVVEANRDKRNLVVSHRAVMERERAENREKLLAELAPGQIREGTVRSLRDFGAFVDLGGVDGLIHVSKMSWDRVNHPSEVLSEGQAVKVKIERIDPETGKIGLSYRESAENPWDSVREKYSVGSRVAGVVSKCMDFGAFVKLEAGVEGLIHISELAHGRVYRTTDAVSEGQKVEVQVMSVDLDKQRIGLSLKALMPAPAKADKDDEEEKLYAVPADAPKAPKKKTGNLKGGTGGPTGGEQFGLKW